MMTHAEQEHAVETNDVDSQADVDRLLKWGIVFSLVWLMGVGSAIAVWNGLRARRLIAKSGGELDGSGRAIWCLVVGTIGILLWGAIILSGLIANMIEAP